MDYTKTKKYKQLKESLLQQLKENENNAVYFVDLVETYMQLWTVCQKLNDDINERGVQIAYKNGNNQFGYKKNDSVNELSKTNAQMLKILAQLNIKAKVIEKAEEEDDEL